LWRRSGLLFQGSRGSAGSLVPELGLNEPQEDRDPLAD